MKYLWIVFWLITGISTSTFSLALETSPEMGLTITDGMVSLTDEELAQEQGQALFNLSYLAPGQNGNPTAAASNIGFYTLGIEAVVSINANIRNLQLGCGGVNGSGGCDIDIQNFSLGCVANSAGTCISVNPVGNQKPGAVRDCGGTSCTGTGIDTSQQQQLKDFVLTNPFYQFAIRNPNSASTREIVGMRIGAASVNGPMSFGSLNSFSGYLTGVANLAMQGEMDVAATCKTPDVCADAAGRSKFTDASAYLKLNDARVLSLGIGCTILGVCVNYRDLTVKYGLDNNGNISQIARNNLPVTVNGNRLTQAQIANLQLAGVVDDIIYGTSSIQPLSVDRSNIGGLWGGIADLIANGLLPLLRDGISVYIKQQLAGGLGLSTNETGLNDRLNNYLLPYNLNNVHQLDVSSNLFGLAVSSEALQYPGYAAAVPKGWSMYIPNGFALNINDKVSSLVSNIAGNANARNGNIIGLEAPFRNCWGTLTFC